MKIINLFLSFLYALGRFALGLLLHPYQTMQLLTEQKLFVWLSLLPTIILGVLTILWKVFGTSFLVFFMSKELIEASVLLSFITTWVAVFMIYWQLLLFYLLVRFKFAFNKDN